MELSDMTARQMFEHLSKNPTRPRYGFGTRPMLINVDLQCAYTQPDIYKTGYETDPKQTEYINKLASETPPARPAGHLDLCRLFESGDDCGVFGSRTDTPDSLQNIKVGSPRAALDPRLDVVDRRDVILNKKMPSAFFETHVASLADIPQDRYGHRHRRLDLRLRAGDGCRQPVARLPNDRADRMRGRPT